MSSDNESIINSLIVAFDNKISYDTISRLLKEHEDVDKVVDVLLVDILLGQENAKDKQVTVSQEENEFVKLESEKEISEVPSASSSMMASVLNEVDITQSTIAVLQNVAKSAEDEKQEAHSQESNVKFFQDRIESLSSQLEEATKVKAKVEEEKRNALKWCVAQVTSTKEILQQKEELIKEQEQEILKLKKQLEELSQSNEKKLEKFIVDSKGKLIEGFESVTNQISENVAKVQTSLKNDEKEWIFVKKLQEFAADFKRELIELIRSPAIRPHPHQMLEKPDVSQRREFEEEKEMWLAEKSSLESYIKELETRLKFYEDAESLRTAKLMAPVQPQNQPSPPPSPNVNGNPVANQPVQPPVFPQPPQQPFPYYAQQWPQPPSFPYYPPFHPSR